MVAGGQALSGRRCLRLVSMRRGLPDWRDAARRADCRWRPQRRLRVAERRRSCRVPRDARSSGRADIQRAAERAGRRTVARGLAAAESIAGRVRSARARRRAATASAVSRRHLVAHSAAEHRPASGRLEHHRTGARCQHPPRLPERRRGASAIPLPSPSTAPTVRSRCTSAEREKCGSRTSRTRICNRESRNPKRCRPGSGCRR